MTRRNTRKNTNNTGDDDGQQAHHTIDNLHWIKLGFSFCTCWTQCGLNRESFVCRIASLRFYIEQLMFLIEDLSYDWRPTINIRFDYSVRAVARHASVARASSIPCKCETECERSSGSRELACTRALVCVCVQVRVCGCAVFGFHRRLTCSFRRQPHSLRMNSLRLCLYLFLDYFDYTNIHKLVNSSTSMRPFVVGIFGNQYIWSREHSVHINGFINKIILFAEVNKLPIHPIPSSHMRAELALVIRESQLRKAPECGLSSFSVVATCDARRLIRFKCVEKRQI